MPRPEDYRSQKSCRNCDYCLHLRKTVDSSIQFCAYGESELPLYEVEKYAPNLVLDIEEDHFEHLFRKKYADGWYEDREAYGLCSKHSYNTDREYVFFDPVERYPEQFKLFKEMSIKQMNQKEENNVVLSTALGMVGSAL